METELGAKLLTIELANMKSLHSPKQKKWELVTQNADAQVALEVLQNVHKTWELKRTELTGILKPMSIDIAALYEEAAQASTAEEHEHSMKEAAVLWAKINKFQESYLDRASMEEEMARRFKEEAKSQEVVMQQDESQATFLHDKVLQLEEVIAEHRSEAGKDVAMAEELTKDLVAEVSKDKGALARKQDELFYAKARLFFMKHGRIKNFEHLADMQTQNATAQKKVLDAKLSAVQHSVVQRIVSMWKTAQSLNDIAMQQAKTMEIIRKAQVELAPEFASGIPALSKATVPSSGAASSSSTASSRPKQSPLEWEQRLHDQKTVDVDHVKQLLVQQLRNGASVRKYHSAEDITLDTVENRTDAELVQDIQEQVKKLELDCRKYPLLCTVGLNTTDKPKLPVAPPPGTDVVEVAKQLVSQQAEAVAQAQADLAAKQTQKDADPAEVEKLDKKLQAATQLMLSAKNHLKAIEGNKVENEARNLMKTAKERVEMRVTQLEYTIQQDPPLQAVIEKTQERLENDMNVLDEARNQYKSVLSVAKHKLEADIMSNEAELSQINAGIVKAKKQGATEKNTAKLKKEATSLKVEIQKDKAEIQRLQEAIKNAGASGKPPQMYYFPTEKEQRTLDGEQTSKMMKTITAIINHTMAPPKYIPSVAVPVVKIGNEKKADDVTTLQEEGSSDFPDSSKAPDQA